MTPLDWVLVVVWLGLTLGGFWKGAVRIIFGGGGLAAGLWLAVVAGAVALLIKTITAFTVAHSITLADIDADDDYEVVLQTAHSGVVAYDLPGSAAANATSCSAR